MPTSSVTRGSHGQYCCRSALRLGAEQVTVTAGSTGADMQLAAILVAVRMLRVATRAQLTEYATDAEHLDALVEYLLQHGLLEWTRLPASSATTTSRPSRSTCSMARRPAMPSGRVRCRT